jgi:hypothetical protein
MVASAITEMLIQIANFFINWPFATPLAPLCLTPPHLPLVLFIQFFVERRYHIHCNSKFLYLKNGDRFLEK